MQNSEKRETNKKAPEAIEMRTNLRALGDSYRAAFAKNELFEKTEVSVIVNSKKEHTGAGSITIAVTPEKSGNPVTGTLYIVEKPKSTCTLFVNEHRHDIVYSNMGTDSVEKAEKYVMTYFERSVMRMLGLEIKDGSEPKKN